MTKRNDFFKTTFSRFLSVLLIVMLVYSCFGGCIVFADENEMPFGTRYEPTGEVGYGLELLSETESFETIDTFDSGVPASPSEMAALPARVDLSEDDYFPLIGNQGNIGSCASWATAYYQYSYQRARLNNWNLKSGSNNHLIASPKYIYNFLNHGNNYGATSLAENYYILMTQGSVSLDDFPYSSSLNWYEADNEAETIDALHNALNTTITSYTKNVFPNSSSSPIVTGYNDSDLYNIKSLLSTGHCLTFATYINNFFYEELDNGKKICVYMRSVSTVGHGMTIVGYDDTIWIDLDGENDVDDFEYGAFKIANSWGTDQDDENQGFLWVSYDVLNSVSNADRLNYDDRDKLFAADSYYSIEVANNSPKLTVEITVEQKYRNNFSVSLGCSDTEDSARESISLADINRYSGEIGFDGETNEYQTRTLVLDYSSCCKSKTLREIVEETYCEKVDLYAGADKVYWVDVKDRYTDDDANTIVKKICWKDENKNVIKQIVPNETLNGTTGSYSVSPADHVRLELNKDTSYLCVGEQEQLTAEFVPADIGEADISWSSNNEEVATVSSTGQVTGIDYGSAVITATAEEYGISATCLVQVVHPVESVTINRAPINIMMLGENDFLTASVSPSTAEITDVIWSSSDPNIVSISEDGFLTVTGYGTATITATAADGKGAFATCMYTISDDYYGYAAKAKRVYENVEYSGDINYAGDGDYFLFTPEVSGTYTIYTKGNLDTKGFLYDWQDNLLTSNDDWGYGNTTNFGIQFSLVAGEDYYIRVVSYDGTTTGSYTLVVGDDHANNIFIGTPITLHSSTSGILNSGDDVDWFEFTPSVTGVYLFYTTGSTDTKGTLYNLIGGPMKENNNGGIFGTNFAIAFLLNADETYCLKLTNNNSDTGAYTLIVAKAFYSANYANINTDARKVQMSAEAASVLTNLTVTINGTSYSLTKPASGDLDTTVNGVRFKVTFTSKNSGLSTLWNITANIPATAIGNTTTTKFTFSKGVITDVFSSDLTGLIAYGSSYKTNLTPNSYLSTLLSSMSTTGYTFTAYDWNDQQIAATTTTKVATGQKIVQRNAAGDIVHIYYLVLYGDVAGSGVVGDGLINATDSMKVLQEVEETFMGVISKLAADADHDAVISEDDAELILQHAVGKATINQNVAITQAVDSSCYFGTSVVF